MKETVIQAVLDGMRAVLTDNQLELLTDVTRRALSECEITPKLAEEEQRNKENAELLGAFISSKKVEGCSDKTIHARSALSHRSHRIPVPLKDRLPRRNPHLRTCQQLLFLSFNTPLPEPLPSH